MLNIPILRHGTPYTSIDTFDILHHATGQPVARVSQANPGLISRDIARMDHDILEQFRMRELLDEILAFHSGQALDRVRKDTDRDFIMSGTEAKEYGIVDEVLTNRELAAVPSAEGTS